MLLILQKLFRVNQDRRRALVFPAVNATSRLCLTTVVNDAYPDLTTFDVGDDTDSRAVVCRQDSVVVKRDTDVDVENDRNAENSRRNADDKSSSRKQRRPDRAVYVPPGSNRRSGQSGNRKQVSVSY